jgi:hypothetical protein
MQRTLRSAWSTESPEDFLSSFRITKPSRELEWYLGILREYQIQFECPTITVKLKRKKSS